MAAMFRIYLRKTKHFRVGQLSTNFFAYFIQILNFIGTERQTFLFIISCDIFNIYNRIRLLINREDFLCQCRVHPFQHRVVVDSALYRRCCRNRTKLFYTQNAANTHVLGNLHGICTPGCNHFTARTDIITIKGLLFKHSGIPE
ncbi:hypothetical protein SDC9_64745 [bioreactor metagenome]|uniref:Uncharacterized protein n=1 Tax=bioreactor metagenome TaxID=1076179 RepID=A0A644XQ60_9ZZZZ